MSSGRPAYCALCTTQSSITSCDGCQRRFCYACLDKHRKDLSLELDELFNRRNELVEAFNRQLPSESFDAHPCAEQIARWQNEMHANIDRIAEQARTTLRTIVEETRANVNKELDQVSQEMQWQQKSNGYLENDLQRIKQQLIKLDQTVQRLEQHIRVDTSNSQNVNWHALISVGDNRRAPVNATSVFAPSLTNSFDRNSPHTMSLSRQQYSPYTSASSSTNPYRVNMSASVGARPLTYTCVGCKTVNTLEANRRNFCSVCRSAAPF